MKLVFQLKKTIVLSVLTILPLIQANAQNVGSAEQLNNTLNKIKTTGKVSIGFRGAAFPLAYYSEDKKPIGYAIDICSNIAEQIKLKLNIPDLKVEFIETNPENRMTLVNTGQVDYECGATSNNEERRKIVAFSIPYYIDAVKMITKTNSVINTLEDIRGKKIAFAKGTVAIPIMKKFDMQRKLGIQFQEYPTYKDALDSVDKGVSSAMITNALLLEGMRINSNNPESFTIKSELLSVEPTAIMFRKDDKVFKDFINKEMVRIIATGQMERYYQKWFLSPIPPKNRNLNIPPSTLLLDIFRNPTDIIGN